MDTVRRETTADTAVDITDFGPVTIESPLDITDPVLQKPDPYTTHREGGPGGMTPAEADAMLQNDPAPAIPAPVTNSGRAAMTGKDFKRLITAAAKFAAGSNCVNKPLSCIGLEISEDVITATATDGEHATRQAMPAVDITPGPATLLAPAHLLQKLAMKFAKREEIDITLETTTTWKPETRSERQENGEFTKVPTGDVLPEHECRVVITAGRSRIEIPSIVAPPEYLAGTSSKQYDEDEDGQAVQHHPQHIFTVDAGRLIETIKRVSFAAVKESSSGAVHYTNGMLIDLEDHDGTHPVTVVATDGHRLTAEKLQYLGIDTEAAEEAPVRAVTNPHSGSYRRPAG